MTRALAAAAIIGALIVVALLAGAGGVLDGHTSANTPPPPIADLSKEKPTQAPGRDGFFIAPTDMVKADANAPVYQLTLDDLQSAWKALMATQPGLTQVGTSLNGMQIDYVQAQDAITVRFIPLRSDPATISFSTLAVYSRALTGRSAPGSNEARVRAWLGQIPGELEQ